MTIQTIENLVENYKTEIFAFLKAIVDINSSETSISNLPKRLDCPLPHDRREAPRMPTWSARLVYRLWIVWDRSSATPHKTDEYVVKSSILDSIKVCSLLLAKLCAKQFTKGGRL
ncbi:MAG: hypothetical protein GY850_22450 [bacterium]|nr:hypothetical protein [bacterium]